MKINTPSSFFNWLLAGAMGLLMAITACEKDDQPVSRNPLVWSIPSGDTLPPVITENTVLIKDRIWCIKGLLYVANDATLMIEPGTNLKLMADAPYASNLTPPCAGIVVTRGARIIAAGASHAPISFLHADTSLAGHRAWHGIVIIGRARIAKGKDTTGYLPRLRRSFPFGGQIPDDSSGILDHVIIQCPSLPGTPDARAIELLGTGSRTIVRNIQVCAPDAQLRRNTPTRD